MADYQLFINGEYVDDARTPVTDLPTMAARAEDVLD